MTEALRRSIYREHLEECAMLYERRRLCLEDPESALEDIVEHDERMEAHIDGLVLGGALAVEICEQILADGDPGDLHAVARVSLRGDEVEALAVLGAFLDIDDEDQEARADALGSALALELSPSWVAQLGEALESPRLGPLVARALGCRRIHAAGPALAELLVRQGKAVDPSVVWALGELRYQPALGLLHQLLRHADEPRLWSAIALACLALGDTQIHGLLRSSAELSRWSPLGQVLSFEVPTQWLLAALGQAPTTELIVALALRGDSGSFAALLQLLDHAELGGLVAGALFTITGAPLLGVTPEPVEDDEPTEDGEPTEDDEPTDEPPDEPGWMELCRDAERWREWLSPRLERWPAGGRWRLGADADGAATRCAALCCAVPLVIREALFDELALRHGVDPGLRATALARAQLERLRVAEQAPPVLDRKEARP